MSDLYISRRLTIADKEIHCTTARSSGPGGQNVNKVNSKVILKWSPQQCASLDPAWLRRFLTRYGNRINRDGELVLHGEKYRDQSRNMADVRQRLVDMLLACQSAPRKRKATRPTLASKRRRLDKKRQTADKKRLRKTPPRDA